MKKLMLLGEPVAVPEAVLLDAEDGEHALADYKGKWVVLNFWATWCAPCREEMPSLDALQGELGGKDFQVVAIAAGHNPPPAIEKFMTEAKIANLPVLLDPRQGLAREMARYSINVNCVCPGPTETPMLMALPENHLEAFRKAIPFKRFGQPSEVADAIVFFASDKASYITGQTLSVSGGLTMF